MKHFIYRWFGSPVVAGAILASLVALLTGGGLWWQGTKTKWKNIGSAEATQKVEQQTSIAENKNVIQSSDIEVSTAKDQSQLEIDEFARARLVQDCQQALKSTNASKETLDCINRIN